MSLSGTLSFFIVLSFRLFDKYSLEKWQFAIILLPFIAFSISVVHLMYERLFQTELNGLICYTKYIFPVFVSILIFLFLMLIIDFVI